VRRSGNSNQEDGETVDDRGAWGNLDIEEYGPVFIQDRTQFFTTSKAIDYFEDLVATLREQHHAVRISGSSLRLKYETTLPAEGEEAKEAIPVKVDI